MIAVYIKESETEMNGMLLCISRYVLILTLAGLPAARVIAMPIVDVNTVTRHVQLINLAEYLDDPAGKLTLEEVRQLPSNRFSRLTQDNYLKGVTPSAFWIRFAVRNTDATALDWVIQHGQGFADFVDFWIVVDGKIAEHAVGGDRTILAERQLPYRYPAARHISLPGEISQVYIRLHNTHTAAVDLLFTLDSGIEFARRSTISQSLLGIMYGIPLTLAFLALTGWVVSRDRSLAMFGLYAMAILAAWLAFNGELAQHVFADSPTLANNASHIFILLGVAFGTMFARDFLNTRELLPRMDQSMRLIIWVACGGIMLRLMGIYTLVAQLSMLMLCAYLISPIWGWCAMRRGVVYARWYIAAQAMYWLMIAAFVFIGRVSVSLYSDFIPAFIGIPFIAELLLLAVARHDRTRILQREKDKADRESMEAISRSEARLRTMADHLPILIAYIDREERYRFCNQHHETMMHMRQDDLLDRRICDVIGKDNYATLASHIEKVWTGQTVFFERAIEKYGARQHIQYKYIPDLGKDGEVIGFYSLISDITERKEAQRKQLASEKLLRAVTDNLPALVCYIDQEHRFQFNNRLYEKWFNRPISEITGRKVREIYGEEMYQQCKSYFDLVLMGQNAEFEFETKFKNDVRYYRATYVPQTDEHGIVNGICGLISDITAMKKITEEYRRQKLEADIANASKSRFLAAASHDLRQPLHALGLLTANLKTATSEAARRQVLEDIERVLEGMDSQFHALLDVSKLDAGVIKPESFDFPINDLLESITTEYGGQAAEKGLKLIVRHSRLVVHSDPVLIGQVLRNLVSNAIKHSKSGHITVGCASGICPLS